jgi:DNA adenine methylase
LWSTFNILTREHFYHVGGSEKNRNPMIEAVVTNYNTSIYENQKQVSHDQLTLFEKQWTYSA